ncbi:hypothetical protein OIU78_024686 [Salix suchowensis]|nr:hypothetical protein OIU78_024686 [Salix suchowensis]
MHSHPQPRTYHFPRKLVAVQGVVYCKSCNYSGVDTLLGAKPVPGATVKLQCNNTRYPLEVKTVSDQKRLLPPQSTRDHHQLRIP